MRCRRYLHAALSGVACVLFSCISLILQGCGDAPSEVDTTTKGTPPDADALAQAVARHYADVDATFPEGRPKELTVEERYADPSYSEALNQLIAEGTRLNAAAAEATAAKEAFAKALIDSQNRRAAKAGSEPLNETLKANLLRDNSQYQLLVTAEAEAKAAVVAHQQTVQATIAARRRANQTAYDQKLSEADAAARAAGLPTRSEWLKQSKQVAQ